MLSDNEETRIYPGSPRYSTPEAGSYFNGAVGCRIWSNSRQIRPGRNLVNRSYRRHNIILTVTETPEWVLLSQDCNSCIAKFNVSEYSALAANNLITDPDICIPSPAIIDWLPSSSIPWPPTTKHGSETSNTLHPHTLARRTIEKDITPRAKISHNSLKGVPLKSLERSYHKDGRKGSQSQLCWYPSEERVSRCQSSLYGEH